MTTATHRPRRHHGGPATARERKVFQHLYQLPKKQWARLIEFAKLLQVARDDETKAEIVEAVFEIVFPESIGGVGDIDAEAEKDVRSRVEEYRKKVGKSIRRHRQALEMSQQRLAELAGIPQSHVSRLELGRHTPTYLTIKRVAEALRTKPSQLDPGFSDDEDEAETAY